MKAGYLINKHKKFDHLSASFDHTSNLTTIHLYSYWSLILVFLGGSGRYDDDDHHDDVDDDSLSYSKTDNNTQISLKCS